MEQVRFFQNRSHTRTKLPFEIRNINKQSQLLKFINHDLPDKKMAYHWYYCLCKVSKYHLCEHAAIRLLAAKGRNDTINEPHIQNMYN